MNWRFNKWSGYYSEIIGFIQNCKPEQVLNYLVENFDLPSNNGKILDIGCGKGSFMLKLLESGKKVIGLDVKTGYSKLAVEKNKGAIILGDGCNLPIRNEHFERVLLMHILHHVDEQTQRKIIKESKRVLKKDGRIIIFEHVRSYGIKGVFLNYLWKLFDSAKKFNKLSEWVDLFEKNNLNFKIKKFNIEGHRFRDWYRIFELEVKP
jgi:ubiquinone/menaquinone biosynthesis C-methylase UbiE